VSRGPGAAARASELVLGRYRLEERIGSGGFGVVWRARDEKLERDVAVKVVPKGGDAIEDARIQREALAAARLNHPGIVALYELGSDDHDVYLVSELVHGATLDALAREGALSDRDIARIGRALSEALEHAHARGVIHRDMKPGNVMVLAEPAAGAGFAKLTDFGIAQLERGDVLTATGDVVGTLAYMAPEQAEGARVTPACDVYSLALTLYEAWTGANPVRGSSPAATARRLGGVIPPLRERRPDLPPELGEAIDAALDADPGWRPAPAELRAVLAGVEDSLDDAGGLVEPATIRRFGLTAVLPRTRVRTLLHKVRTEEHAIGSEAAGGVPFAALRAAAGLAAGILMFVALQSLGPRPPLSSFTAAAITTVLVSALPRVGWIAAGLGLCAWLASPDAGHPGTALVVAAALVATPLFLPRAGLLWSVPAVAPLLGVIGLAPAFVGLAALCSTAWRRAGLAAAGFLWLLLTEAVTGDNLLFGSPDGTAPRGAWQGSVLDAASDALWPLLSSPALLPVVVWVAFAVVFPVVVRGRWTAVDLLAAALWGAGLAVCLGALGDVLAASMELDRARGAIAGSVFGALIAFAVTVIAPPVEDEEPAPALP
jgi:tRNA A-37 threonylcarbamoyl transferase component Bud32